MTSPRKSRSTLRRVEEARARWKAAHIELRESVRAWVAACAAHAAAKAKRGKGK